MRDFPVFDTQNGVGSLILKQIPYTANAYIQIQAASDAKAFLDECVDFCRLAGAKHIYAGGHGFLKEYPVYTTVLEMAADGTSVPKTDACLFPVTESGANHWQKIYNEKMKNVPGSAWYSFSDMQKLVKEGGGYFVHRNGQLLGIGIAKDEQILAVASVVSGGGKDVVCALCETLSCDKVTLQVASTNTKAITLYKQLGFLPCKELGRWHTIV